MVSQTTGGDKTGTHKVKGAARKAVEGTEDAVRGKREQVAEALDDAGEAIGEQANEGSRRESATAVKARLSAAADYVRETNIEDMGRDAREVASEYPIAAVLVASAVVIGGGLLVSSLLRAEQDADGRPRGASLSGRAGADAVTKIRDAAISFAVSKIVASIEDVMPGFREHYEKA